MTARPNILLITSDQQRGDCFGFEGRAIQTPHLDAMAERGTRFSACITPNVYCQPSRASILTGLLPLTHGVRDNGIDLRPAVGEAGFAGQLAKAGWATSFIGKAHFSTRNTSAATGTPECQNSSDRFGHGWTGPYMGFQYVETVSICHHLKRMTPPPKGLHYEWYVFRDGHGPEHMAAYGEALPPVQEGVDTWHSAFPSAFHHSSWVGDRTVARLREHAPGGALADKPFCLWASFPDPHHPFDAPDPWSRLHHPDAVDLPEHRTRDFERRPWWHRASQEAVPQIEDQTLLSRILASERTPPQTDRQLREIIANYYGMISLIDHNVGRILDALQRGGLAENTIVVFTTDHGDWLGDHGLVLKGPMHYEGLLRVGCIVQGPGVPAGQVVAEPVSTLDLPATFHDYAQVPLPREPHGRSLRPLIERTGETRDFALNEWDRLASNMGMDLRLRTVRTHTHKLTVERLSGDGELYDLANDPHELDNRWNDPGAAAVQRELLDMLAARPEDALTTFDEPVGFA